MKIEFYGVFQMYLDNAASTKIDLKVKNEMDKCFKIFANPSSSHSLGKEAKQILQSSRERVAKVLNCEPAEIVFTSGGTESINLAIQGVARAQKQKGKHIITSKIEHPAVLETCKFLAEEGFEVTHINVDSEGVVDVEQLENSIKKDTILITIMHGNNEIGTIQPIEKISKIAKEKNVCFHTDACQTAGTLELDVQKLGIDLLTLNGSKIYGPKGIGILYVKNGTRIKPIIFGGGQENGLRSGTENIPAIVGFAKALELARSNRVQETERLEQLRDDLIKQIKQRIPDAIINGSLKQRLPNNISISFKGIDGSAVVDLLDEKKICVSSGSACTSQSIEPSHVLKAIGLSDESAEGSVRITLGKETTQKDINTLVNALTEIIRKLRE